MMMAETALVYIYANQKQVYDYSTFTIILYHFQVWGKSYK